MEEDKNSTPPATTTTTTTTTVSEDVSSESLYNVNRFFSGVGVSKQIPKSCDTKDFYSDLIRGLFKVHRLESGQVTCLISVKPVITNAYGGLHGGAVAALAERVSIACARTVVGQDKDLFLGELSMSYLSAAPSNSEVIVDASVVRSGRNLTVIAVEFRHKESGKLTYTSRATFYNMPVASL